jgi:hypothetical protein
MKGFTVLDTFGNLKLAPLGSGALLPDPVSVVHGGTGLIAVAQGDLLYASAAGVLARLPKDSGGARVLANSGPANNPAWIDPATGLAVVPLPTSRKVAWAVSTVTAATPLGPVWSGTSGTTLAGDPLAPFIRFGPGASIGSVDGYRLNADWCYLDHAPLVLVYLRTGPVLTNVRLWVTLSDAPGFFTVNADDQHLRRGVGFRFSSVADAGLWVPWTADGTTQTIGTPMTAILPSTVYLLSIAVASGGTAVTLTINGDAAHAQTVAIGAAALLTPMRLQVQLMTLDAVAKVLDFSAAYGEWN